MPESLLNELQVQRPPVRDYAGDRLDPVAPSGTGDDGGPDPVLEAMRTDFRHGLMLLTERQLRSVWRLMQS